MKFSAWNGFLLVCLPLALLTIFYPFILNGYKYFMVRGGMRTYDAKKICSTGYYTGVQIDGEIYQYECSGAIYGLINLVGLPLGKKWRYTCVVEFETERQYVIRKRFMPFSRD